MEVFISSTIQDLADEREALARALADEFDVSRMEDFGSGPEPPLDACLAAVEEADIYVLLIGSRYGSIAPSADISYTHAEYEHAQRVGKPVFAYIRAGLEASLLTSTEPPRHIALLQDLVAALEAGGLVRRPFASVDELARSVTTDLTRWRDRGLRRPRFGNPRRTIRDPLPYAAATAGRVILQLYPYVFTIVDLLHVEAQDFPTEGTRIRDKLVTVHDALRDRGANVVIFNQIRIIDMRRESVLAQRVRSVTNESDAILCVAHGNADIDNVQLFEQTPKVLAFWYPESLPVPAVSASMIRHYSPDDVRRCSLQLEILDYTDQLLSIHMVEHAGQT